MVGETPTVGQDRRAPSATEPWRVFVSRQPGRFVAENQLTGRSYALPVSSRSEAEAQVDMLNRYSLEIRA